MPRVKRGVRAHQKHKKLLKLAKGYRGTRSKLYRRAHEAVIRAGEHAFAGRRIRRRDLRTLWITRLSGALSDLDINYSTFIKALKLANIELDRKVLSDLAITDNKAFVQVVAQAKQSLEK